MLILPIVIALAANSTAVYPESFTARCTDAEEAYVWLGADDMSHPEIRRPVPPAIASSGPVAIPGYVPPHGNIVTVAYRNSQFSVEVRGVDFDVVQINGREFHFKAIKTMPGDLVLSVQTSTWGESLTVYHLRYRGKAGALSIARTRYDGHGRDQTSLTVMTCKIGPQSFR